MKKLQNRATRSTAIGLAIIAAACARPAPNAPAPDLILKGGRVLQPERPADRRGYAGRRPEVLG
jgi:hypothetical protein